MMHVRRKFQPSSRTKTFAAASGSKGGLNPIFENEIVSTVRFNLPPSNVFLPLSSESSNGFEGDDSIWASSDDSQASAPLASLSQSPTDTSEQRAVADELDDGSDSHFSMAFSHPSNAADLGTEAEERRRFDRDNVLDEPIGVSTQSLVATVGAGSAASMASNAASSRDSCQEPSTSPEGSPQVEYDYTRRWTFF